LSAVTASDQLTTSVISSALTTLAIVIGILINDWLLRKFTRAIDARFAELNESLRVGIASMRQDFDARRNRPGYDPQR
jgi:hypothetical protein